MPVGRLAHTPADRDHPVSPTSRPIISGISSAARARLPGRGPAADATACGAATSPAPLVICARPGN